MIPYHRAVSAWAALKKHKEIPGYLKKLGIPVPKEIKVMDRDASTKKFAKWFKNQEMNPDIDIAYYQILQILPRRKLVNTLLLLKKTPEEIQYRLDKHHKLLIPEEALTMYAELFWDVHIDFNDLLASVQSFNEEERRAYLAALLGVSWEAELEAGLIPDVSITNFLKLTITSGLKAVSKLLQAEEISNPDKVIALALRASELLKDIEKASDSDPTRDLAFGLTLVEKDEDATITMFDGKILQTNKAED